jgi:hypothetical protein
VAAEAENAQFGTILFELVAYGLGLGGPLSSSLGLGFLHGEKKKKEEKKEKK